MDSVVCVWRNPVFYTPQIFERVLITLAAASFPRGGPS